MVALVALELEPVGDALEHGGAGTHLPPLLEARVVVDAEAAQHREFLAAKPGNPSDTAAWQSERLRGEAPADGAQVPGEGEVVGGHGHGHGTRVGGRSSASLVLLHPGTTGRWSGAARRRG